MTTTSPGAAPTDGFRMTGRLSPGEFLADGLDFDAARAAVARLAPPTPLVEAPELSERVGRPVLLKLETLQVTGSFKMRGAAARLAALDDEERTRGVVACSSGNHGRAVAWVAGRMGVPATVCVPDWVDPVKLEGIRACGAEAVLAGPTYDGAEVLAQELARSTGRTFVSAFDDPGVVAGQGTVALEVLGALDTPPCAILAALSGGGLVGGIAAALRWACRGSTPPPTVGVTAERAGVMLASLQAGRPVELPEEETIAGALSGGIGLDNRVTFTLVRDLVDDHVVVSEASIRRAMAWAFLRQALVVEGGGATALAALLDGAWTPDSETEGPVVVVVSGGNVGLDTLGAVLNEAPARG